MVLCADHELNPSSYTARVAASTGSSISAAITAALATFSGESHGRHPTVWRRWIEEKTQAKTPTHNDSLLGFGHPLYPDGDPRGKALIALCPLPKKVQTIADKVFLETGLKPNIDFALANFEMVYDLPRGSASQIFAIGRLCGWVAHYQEQKTLGHVIRPRAYGHLSS